MAAHARPQDLLLAYDTDFVGFSSNEMAQPLEPVSFLAAPDGLLAVSVPAVGVLGGTPDPDGYYEDFTARLATLSRRYPRRAEGGGSDAAQPETPLDWGALVLSVDLGQSSDEDTPSSDEDAQSSDEVPPSSDEDAPSSGAKDEVPLDIEILEKYTVEATGGTSPVISFSEFIVEAEGGNPPRNDNVAVLEGVFVVEDEAMAEDDDAVAEDDDAAAEDDDAVTEDDDAVAEGDGAAEAGETDAGDEDDENAEGSATFGGEMDETGEEMPPYEVFRTLPLGQPGVSPIASMIVSL